MLSKLLPKKIANNPEFIKILTNINWLFLDRIIQMILAFFIGVWIIRYLGPEQYGILSYVIAFVTIFSVLSELGLNTIAIREMLNNKFNKEKIFGTIFFLKLYGGIFAVILSSITVFLINNNPTITLMVFIASLSLIFRSSDVIDYWLQSQVVSKYSVYTRTLSSIGSAIIKICLILFKAPLIFFVTIILIESIFVFIGLSIVYNKKIKKANKIKHWIFDIKTAKQLLKDSWPLILSSISIIIYMKIDQIMIGNILGDKQLGQYSAIIKLSELWYFIPVLVMNSVFPAILEAKKKSKKLYMNRLQTSYDILVWTAILIAIPISFFAKDIVNLLYGTEFTKASPVLSIHIWAGIAVFLGVASNKFLVAENLTKIFFYITALGVISNLILNIILIPTIGITGAAIATLISYFIATFSLIIFKQTKTNIQMFVKTLNILRIIKFLKASIIL